MPVPSAGSWCRALKEFVIDNTVLYSGASLNDVYLHRHERYRLDRYHLIRNRTLAELHGGGR